jgi:tripartite-type tricarboxylate transporter receptor subunit TctC
MQAGSRCRALLAAASVTFAIAFAVPATAQDYPNKPVRLIVPFAPGGLADTSARAVAEKLGARLGQSVVVENRAGASGNIGMQAVAQSAPDGYTLVLGFDGTVVINPHIFSKPGFDVLADFAPVTKLGDAVLLLVAHPSVPAKNIRELIAYEKTRPGTLSYGTSGTGGTPHLVGELLNQRLGTKFVHIPYKGGGQAVIDVVGGQIPLVFTAVASAQQHVKSGKVIGIGVSSAKRAASLPDVPTFAESGLTDFVVDSWVGILAPARTPKAIVDRLQRELAEVLKDPEVRGRYETLGIEPVANTPEQFGAQIRADLARWEKVVKQAGIKVE